MRSYLYIFFFASLFFWAVPGHSLSTQDAQNGKRQDTTYYSSTKIRCIIERDIAGNRDGEEHCFRPDGTISSMVHYKEGKLHGIAHYYNHNGLLTLSLEYRNGLLNGEAKRYYHNGKLEFLGHYKNGKMHGNRIYFDRKGALREGKQTVRREDSSISMKGTFIEGKPEGLLELFYNDGKPYCQIHFKKGMADGKAIYFNTKGKEESVEFYNQGLYIKQMDKDPISQIDTYNEIIAADPENVMVLFFNALSHHHIDNAISLEYLSKVIQLDPSHYLAYYNRGVIRAESGNKKSAAKDFEQTILLQPKFALAHYNLGYLHFQNKNYQEALTYFSKAIEYDNEFAEAYYNRGIVHKKLKNVEESKVDILKANALFKKFNRKPFEDIK